MDGLEVKRVLTTRISVSCYLLLNNLRKYGYENSFQSEEVKKKSRETMIEKYGAALPLQCESLKQKQRETMIEKYGVENSMHHDAIREKLRGIMIERYGVENAFQNEEFKAKSRETMKSKYGVEYLMQNEEHKEHFKSVMMERYGVENPMQVDEISEKQMQSAYTSKDYTWPSGLVVRIQGYEHFALDELLSEYSESDLLTSRSDVPNISYVDNEGKKHVYFVDIFIPKANKCIEVKSDWTMTLFPETIFLKQKAAKDAGYECEIWVYDSKGKKLECRV